MRFRTRSIKQDASVNRRPGKWRRRGLMLAVIGGVFGLATVAEKVWLQADGLVVGNIADISSLYRARIDKIFVQCNQQVAAGDAIVQVVSEQMQIQFEERLSRLRTEQSELQSRLEEAGDAAEIARLNYDTAKAELSERAARFEAFDRLYDEGVVNRLEWEEAQTSYRQAESAAVTSEARWRSRQAAYDRTEEQVSVAVEAVNSQLTMLTASGELGGTAILRSPRPGVVTACTSFEGQTTAPGEPIFRIFDPATAQIRAYFKPEQAIRLKEGQRISVSLDGINESFDAPIQLIEPNMRPLPGRLARYFWQDPEWAEYLPVRVGLTELSEDQRNQIVAGAKASVTFWNWAGLAF